MLLALNAGSSSLKFAVYATDDVNRRILSGELSRIGTPDGTLTVHGTTTETQHVDLPDHAAAWRALTGTLGARLDVHHLRAVGHRIVHGGAQYLGPVRITPAVDDALRALIPLAPEHMPQALDAIDAVRQWSPAMVQIACFDTAFHRHMPRVAQLFGLPRSLADQGVIRYGFHGLSYEYIVGALRARDALGMRTVIAHLGNGASVAAVRDGKSIDTSMGMTPTGGLVMGTRSGDLDPGVMLYLLRAGDDVARLVNHEGGLLGLSGSTSDMQELLARSDANAREAVEVFCYHVKKTIGAYASALGGLDTLVFTGGIGEHAAPVRASICDGLQFLGVRLDGPRNAQSAEIISADGAAVSVRVIATDEERMIATHVVQVLRDQPAPAA